MLPNPFDCLWKLLIMELERGWQVLPARWIGMQRWTGLTLGASQSSNPAGASWGGEGPLLAFTPPLRETEQRNFYFRKRDNRYECEMTFFPFFFFIAIATVTAAK